MNSVNTNKKTCCNINIQKRKISKSKSVSGYKNEKKDFEDFKKWLRQLDMEERIKTGQLRIKIICSKTN